MNSVAPEFFTTREIARAAGRNKKYWHRLAIRESWPSRRNGNRLEFQPPAALAETILKVGQDASAARTAPPAVKFADLAHDKRARAMVLLRQQAVEHCLQNLHKGKEVALQETVLLFSASPARTSAPSAMVASPARTFAASALKTPTFKISVTSLRRWLEQYTAAGLDGLVEQKRGRVGRKAYVHNLTREQILQLAADAVGHGNWKQNTPTLRTNIARAYQNLVANPTLGPEARQWAHGDHASKSYVPPSVRDAVRQTVSPLAATHLQIGPKAMKLDGPHSECSYENVPAGHAFTADDMTSNCYVWVEWPNEQGWLLIRPQILAVIDIGSLTWLNLRAIIRPRGQYNKDDVWGLIGDTLDHFGRFKLAVLEGGTWQSNVVIGEKTGLDDHTRIGGLQSLGIKVIHTRTPRGKIIEGEFNKLQYAADNVRGYCGRDERVDCPEPVKKALYAVQKGHAHPRQHFLHLKEYTDHLAAVMNQLNQERNDGKILRGQAPIDKWASDKPQLEPMPESAKWMYRSAVNVRQVTNNGVRVTLGTGRYQLSYTYDNRPSLQTWWGRRVAIFWNDSNPDTDAVIYTIKDGRPDKFICVASRVKVLDRFGATDDEAFKAEATRKKLAAQLAVTQSRALAPYLGREVGISSPVRLGPPCAPSESSSEIGTRIAAAKENAEAQQLARARTRNEVAEASRHITPADLASVLTPDADQVEADSELGTLDASAARTSEPSSEMSPEEITALFNPDSPDPF